MVELIDILYYSYEKEKRVPLKECELVTSFVFNKNTFFLVYKCGQYFICIPNNRDLISLWDHKGYDGNIKIPSGEIISEFRKGYLKNKITQEKIDAFIEDPIKNGKTSGKS